MEKIADVRTIQDNYTVIMPTLAGEKSVHYGGYPFIRFISSPEVFYVTYADEHKKAINMFKSLIGNWPLLLIATFLCFEAGILIWLSVSDDINSVYVPFFQANCAPRQF